MILVTGCARSGTSLTAGILHACGADGGDMVGKSPYNPRGFFENRRFRESIEKPLLMALGADPLGQNPLPPIGVSDDEKFVEVTVNEIKSRVANATLDQGMHEPWFYKGAKLTLTWEYWHLAFPDAKWIVTQRPTEDIVNSCMRTQFMSKRNSPNAWRDWVENHLERHECMSRRIPQIRFVDTPTIANGDMEYIKAMVDFAGLQFNEQKVQEFVNPEFFTGADV